MAERVQIGRNKSFSIIKSSPISAVEPNVIGRCDLAQSLLYCTVQETVKQKMRSRFRDNFSRLLIIAYLSAYVAIQEGMR